MYSCSSSSSSYYYYYYLNCPHSLRSRSPPVPVRRQRGVEQVQRATIYSSGLPGEETLISACAVPRHRRERNNNNKIEEELGDDCSPTSSLKPKKKKERERERKIKKSVRHPGKQREVCTHMGVVTCTISCLSLYALISRERQHEISPQCPPQLPAFVNEAGARPCCVSMTKVLGWSYRGNLLNFPRAGEGDIGGGGGEEGGGGGGRKKRMGEVKLSDLFW